MLTNIFLSCALLKSKWRMRGVAMAEYAILLAFVAALSAGVFLFDWSKMEWNEDSTLKGTSLGTAIYSTIFNARSAVDKAGHVEGESPK